MAASEVVYHEDGSVKGVVAGVFGIGKDGRQGPRLPAGHGAARQVHVHRRGRARLARPSMLQAKLRLCCNGREPQKFGIGIEGAVAGSRREFQPGLVQHTFGWPLRQRHRRRLRSCTTSGTTTWPSASWCTSTTRTPGCRPSTSSSASRHHPSIRAYLEGGKRISYGARAITEGGFQSVPQLTFPGGVLIGYSAGFVNVPRIKGSHNAIKSRHAGRRGRLRGPAGRPGGDELTDYQDRLPEDLGDRQGAADVAQRQAAAGRKFGTFSGGVLPAGIDMVHHHAARRVLVPRARCSTARPDAESTGLAKDYRTDRLSQAGRRAQLRQAVLGVPVLDQPRRRPAGAPEAEGPDRSRSP